MTTPDYFALFGLPPRFEIDLAALERAHDRVLSLVHPDRHVGAGPAERRAAMQLASEANEGYRTLRSASARAAYLCRRGGVDADGEGAAPMDRAFLEQQLQWRETLEEARREGDQAARAEIAAQVEAQRRQVLARLARLLDETGDYQAAAAQVRALLFLEKLRAECEAQWPARFEAANRTS